MSVAIGLALVLMAGTVVLAATTKTGGAVKGVKVVTETAAASISSNGYTDVQGMSVSMTVPSGEQALLLITFSAETQCRDGNGSTTVCYLRVLVDGTNAALPGQVAFDTAGDGNAEFTHETNSMQFVTGPLSAGQHPVKVQAFVDEIVSSFTFGGRTL